MVLIVPGLYDLMFSLILGDGWWIGAEVGGDMARLLEVSSPSGPSN